LSEESAGKQKTLELVCSGKILALSSVNLATIWTARSASPWVEVWYGAKLCSPFFHFFLDLALPLLVHYNSDLPLIVAWDMSAYAEWFRETYCQCIKN